MPQPNDLSRSLVALDQNSTIIAVVELSHSKLGEIAGKRLIHLQCHFGLDTLLLAREGAIATRLDFWPAAIAALAVANPMRGSSR